MGVRWWAPGVGGNDRLGNPASALQRQSSYGPPGRSQNATHNAQAGIDTHCSCPSAVRSQYIGPGFPQSFAPSGEHG